MQSWQTALTPGIDMIGSTGTPSSNAGSTHALSDLEKELLGFIHEHLLLHKTAEVQLRDLRQHFAELDTGPFRNLCLGLVDVGLLRRGTQPGGIALSASGEEVARELHGDDDIPTLRESVTLSALAGGNAAEHLTWDLSKVADYACACRFAQQFQRSLCIFSPPVRQLYSNYLINVPTDNTRKLVILPNPYADHDTFNHVTANASVPTRTFITPLADGSLQLMIPAESGKWRAMSLGDGLNHMQKLLGDEPFLPVLSKGDLREVLPSEPVMHLHRLVPGRIQGRSELELRLIHTTIQEKLAEHYGFQPISS